MKIIDKSRSVVPFGDLEAGDLFRDSFGNYYIKTNLFDELNLETNKQKIVNAVSLRTGSLAFFGENHDVCALDAYLVIGGDDKKVTN